MNEKQIFAKAANLPVFALKSEQKDVSQYCVMSSGRWFFLFSDGFDLNDNERKLAEKIMSATKTDLPISWDKLSVDSLAQRLVNADDSAVVVCFGQHSMPLGVSKIKVINTAPIHMLLSDSELKKQLWQEMKIII